MSGCRKITCLESIQGRRARRIRRPDLRLVHLPLAGQAASDAQTREECNDMSSHEFVLDEEDWRRRIRGRLLLMIDEEDFLRFLQVHLSHLLNCKPKEHHRSAAFCLSFRVLVLFSDNAPMVTTA